MSSITGRRAAAAVDAALEALGAIDADALAVGELLEMVQSVETSRRRLTALAADLAAAVDRRDRAEIGGPGFLVVADTARLSPAEARRRLRDSAQLRERTSLTGEPLPPELPATAKAWDAGLLDAEHLRVIQKFLRELPEDLHPARVAQAEAFLAEQAACLRPDQLLSLAAVLADRLNPDGRFTDAHRNRQRGFTWGRQRPDGMSEGRLIATPELRATVDALLAKYAAPGRCNPADPTPAVTSDPSPEIAQRDQRSHAQRQHDALNALLRSQLGNPALGQHNGLPVTIVATTTVEELCTGAGVAYTAAGTRLPITDLIRMASHAWHYLCVYRKHDRRPLYLGRTKRIASADQRLVLYALERGCTFPGCDRPGYHAEVHHNSDWSAGGRTDVSDLTLGCPPHHGLATTGGWDTRRRADGVTEWIPPPHHPHLRGGINNTHHPERLLGELSEPADEEPE
ncbi:MAG: HNH endonuclease signature motif containing protein [Mycobacterium sp.]